MSEIGFGCGGNAGLMVRGTPAERQRVIGRAIDLGINYFDNAPDYGDGVSEENLGRDMKALGIRPIVVSKVEVRQENLGDIADHVVRSTEQSLKRLGIDCLDILQIHNGPSRMAPELSGRSYTQLWIEDYLRPGGAIEGLERVLRAGKARYLGFICRGNDGAEVRQLIDTQLFHMINVPYTLLNPTAGRAAPDGLLAAQDFGAVIPYAHERGVGSAVYSPLAGGFLTDHCIAGGARHPWARAMNPASDAYQRNLKRAQALGFLSLPGTHTLAQAAMRFVLMHQGVSVVLGGYSDVQQLEESVPACCAGPLAPPLMSRIEAVWQDNFGLG